MAIPALYKRTITPEVDSRMSPNSNSYHTRHEQVVLLFQLKQEYHPHLKVASAWWLLWLLQLMPHDCWLTC
jgi:hypothetical protein